ncbi:MAG TPA: hypothetical protein VK803_05720 [Steroidobacteraceae bacterium]|jgi:hypothetical protein|nr:hypothetical protein [Steroidobacteraceae bacterium]
MRKPQTGLAVLAVLALAGGAALADDPPKAEDPDTGFLEFLGSVDRLSEVNPDYLSQADAARSAKPVQPGTSPATSAPPSSPPRPSQPQSQSPPPRLTTPPGIAGDPSRTQQ